MVIFFISYEIIGLIALFILLLIGSATSIVATIANIISISIAIVYMLYCIYQVWDEGEIISGLIHIIRSVPVSIFIWAALKNMGNIEAPTGVFETIIIGVGIVFVGLVYILLVLAAVGINAGLFYLSNEYPVIGSIIAIVGTIIIYKIVF